MKNLLVLLTAAFIFVVPALAQDADRDGGIALYREGKHAEAAAALRKAIEIDQRDGPAWRYLGAALVNLGEKDEALKAFKKGDLDPATFAAERKKYSPAMKIIEKRPADYTAEARRRGLRGEVTVMVELLADGKVGFVVPIRTLEGGLTENAVKAAGMIRFEPAVQNGTPVTTIQLLSYSFNLR